VHIARLLAIINQSHHLCNRASTYRRSSVGVSPSAMIKRPILARHREHPPRLIPERDRIPNENRDCESHWRDPVGPLGAVGSLCTRAGAIPSYAVERALPKEVITLPAAARPPTSHRNFNSCRSYMLIQNQNRFPTASLVPAVEFPKFIYI